MPDTDSIDVPIAEIRTIQDRNEYVSALLEAISLKDMGVISGISVTRLTRLAQAITENNEAAISRFKPR